MLFRSRGEWYRQNVVSDIAALDNYSGLRWMRVYDNGEFISSKNIQTVVGGPITTRINTSTEGTHVFLIRAMDLAGNESEYTQVFRIDKTKPNYEMPINLTDIDTLKQIWINRKQMAGVITLRDFMSGLDNESRNYELYERNNNITRIISNNNIYTIKNVNKTTSTFQFTQEYILSMPSSQHDYVVDVLDTAGNILSFHLYINLDIDKLTRRFQQLMELW